jgi:hypothetical protein
MLNYQLTSSRSWRTIKGAAATLRTYQVQDGSIPDVSKHDACLIAVKELANELRNISRELTHDREYLLACASDFEDWADSGFETPDFYESLSKFKPEQNRANNVLHIVVFPTYTQNGSNNRYVEAVAFEVIWPDFIARVEKSYTNPAFIPIRFLSFSSGYLTNSAVLFPESVATKSAPKFTWGGIFADREAARLRRVALSASEITNLDLPLEAKSLLTNRELAEHTFVLWDLIHDRAHMRGNLPFDPFMIKQRMPFFLYALEELRCDLTAFRECVAIVNDVDADPEARKHARLVQYAVLFDRIFRFPLTNGRERNYDSVAGQLLFAYLHQNKVIHWVDTKLTIDWERLADSVIRLSDDINELYFNSIDRPRTVHWLAAYDLVSKWLPPHPASKWATKDLPLTGTPGDLTDQVMEDEFPLSMFYEALSKKLSPVVQSAVGIII